MRRLLAVACCLLLLPSCGFIASDTELLLHPPALTREQAALNEALANALDISEIVYKYPQRGDYITPFVFYDMDGDGRREAIVFYSYQNDITSTRTMLLRQDASGVWAPFSNRTTDSDQIDFVQFAGLYGDDSACMIVGWQSTTGRTGRSHDSALSVYSLNGDSFSVEIDSRQYMDYLVRDFDGSGGEDIVIAELDDDLRLRLSLLRAEGRRIAESSTLQLCPEADTLLQMLPGRLWDGGNALYIDEIRTDTSVATEVVRVRGGQLTTVVGGERPEDPELELLRWESYTDTWRDEPVLSFDIAGNGLVEVPHPVSLPGNLYEGEKYPLKLTGLLQLTSAGFVVPSSAVINADEGYLVRYPEAWLGRVSVVRDDESAEWRFYDIDPDTLEPVAELLRIRAESSAEPTSGYFGLDSRGQRYFHAYIPLTAEEAPSVEEADVRRMFQLMP